MRLRPSWTTHSADRQPPQATWPRPILRYFRREISASVLLKAATTEIQQTEAHAFLALDLLENGDRDRAIEHLRWVRDHGVPGSIAGDLAKATLRRVDGGGAYVSGSSDHQKQMRTSPIFSEVTEITAEAVFHVTD